MNSPTWAEVAALVATVPAMGAFGLSLAAFLASRKNGRKIEQVHVSINSRMDELLTAKGAASMAAGVEQGRSESRHEAAAENPVKVAIVSVPDGVNKEKPNA